MLDTNIYLEEFKQLMRDEDVEITPDFEFFFDTFGDNDAPASTTRHSNERWGTWKHVVIGSRVLLRRCKTKGYSARSALKVFGCHDMDKWIRGVSVNVLKAKKGQKRGDVSDKKPLYHEEEVIQIPHACNSLFRAMEYFTFDELEMQAILLHMGPYDYNFKWETLNPTEFSMMVHLSDMEATHMLETTHKKDKDTGAYLPDSPPMEYARLLQERAEKGE